MRMVRVALVAAVVSAGLAVTTPSPPTADAAETDHDITDPRLLGEIAEVTGRRGEGVASLSVEVLTADDAAVAAAVIRLGGEVTGTITGEVVQATMPVARVHALADTPEARTVRSPRSAGRLPTDLHRTEFGPGTGTPGQAVSITNAAAWHAAGQGGAGVKVGIVDYFDFAVWNFRIIAGSTCELVRSKLSPGPYRLVGMAEMYGRPC